MQLCCVLAAVRNTKQSIGVTVTVQKSLRTWNGKFK